MLASIEHLQQLGLLYEVRLLLLVGVNDVEPTPEALLVAAQLLDEVAPFDICVV